MIGATTSMNYHDAGAGHTHGGDIRGRDTQVTMHTPSFVWYVPSPPPCVAHMASYSIAADATLKHVG